jgi:RecA/RadA recombinase
VKWRYAMAQWDGDVARAAAQPDPHPEAAPDLSAEFAEAAQKAEQQAKADPAGLYERLDVAQIKNLADPQWLVGGLIVEQALGFIYGPPGCLKTFIALDMALSFATARQMWWDRAIERSGAVIYISSEGQADLKFRIMAWEANRKTNADSAPFRLIRQSINFMSGDDVGKLIATVQAIADETGQKIAAVFVDTVSRVLPGAEENLQKDMTIFVAACDAVRQRFGTTVIGIHHTARAGNMRGSTVIPGAGDFIVEVRREPGAETGSIYATKIKAGEDGWEQHFKVTKLAVGVLSGNTSLALDPVDVVPRESGNGWPERDVCRQILAAIEEQWVKGEPWSFAKNTSRSAVINIMNRFHLERGVVADMLATWTANKIITEEVFNLKNQARGYRKLADI